MCAVFFAHKSICNNNTFSSFFNIVSYQELFSKGKRLFVCFKFKCYIKQNTFSLILHSGLLIITMQYLYIFRIVSNQELTSRIFKNIEITFRFLIKSVLQKFFNSILFLALIRTELKPLSFYLVIFLVKKLI